jgi:hypothetical protein
MAKFHVTYVAQTIYEADVTLDNPNPSIEELEAAIHNMDKNHEVEIETSLNSDACLISNISLENVDSQCNISNEVGICQKISSSRKTFIQSIEVKEGN